MKKTTLCFLFSLPLLGAAQCYTVSTINYAPDPYTAGTAVNVNDDQWSVKIPIGFSFCFYNGTYDSLVIGANAIISFNTSQAQQYCAWPVVGAIPTSADPMNVIMAGWEDLAPSMGGTVKYALYGNSPTRRLVISYSAVPMYQCSTSLFTGQVVLYETTNVIDINIQDKFGCPQWNGGYAIEGLHNSTGTYAIPVTGRNFPTQWTATNDAKRFTPAPSCYVCSHVGIGADPVNTVSLEIYPNPSSGSFSFVLNEHESGDLRVFNSLGELVQEKKILPGNNQVDLSGIQTGIYYYRINIADGRSGSGVLMRN